MPRPFSYRETKTVRGVCTERAFTITYSDDSPERRDAVAFFNAKPPGYKNEYRMLRPEIDLPREIESMSPENAQEYLDSHPMEQRWRSLIVHREDLIVDQDLERLRYVPEIRYATITSSRISDRGVKHLRHLTGLRMLVLYSRRVSSRCLADIASLQSLELLDLQMCPWISRSTFAAATAQLPALKESFPPLHRPLSTIVRWFYTEWQVQRRQVR